MRSTAHTILGAAMILAVVAVGASAGAQQTRFKGEVGRGETVVHRFEHGGVRYEFRLLPTPHGWTIWIGDPMYRDRNFVLVATPPYRGINPAVIEGWHFRNADNTAANAPGPKNVNAPQRNRTFAFVLNGSDFLLARAAVETLLWPGERAEKDLKEARERLARVRKAAGQLQVGALEFGTLTAGERAAIERMAFSVKIDWPAAE